MKKLIFIFAAFVAVSFASCGNKTSEPAVVVSDSDSSVVVADSDSVSVSDSLVADSAVVTDSLVD